MNEGQRLMRVARKTKPFIQNFGQYEDSGVLSKCSIKNKNVRSHFSINEIKVHRFFLKKHGIVLFPSRKRNIELFNSYSGLVWPHLITLAVNQFY